MRKAFLTGQIAVLFLTLGCVNIFSPLFLDPAGQDPSNLSDVNFLNDMGDYYADIGDYTTAKKFYQRALEINPRSSRALIGIANCELFSLVQRTNIIGFYHEVSSNIAQIANSNLSGFVDYFVSNQRFFKVARVVSSNLYIVITGNSDNPSLSNNDNLHLSFSIFNKINSFHIALDSNKDDAITTNDTLYVFLLDTLKQFDTNSAIPNEFILGGDYIDTGMRAFFREGKKSIESLSFVTNKFNSKESSLEAQILKTFVDVDAQLTNVYTNFLKTYEFYLSMYRRIVELLTNNGIPLYIATNTTKLTNSLNITNYSNFDNKDITNILTTDNINAWNILTNYLDLNKLTN